jgi:hypothetical protein
LAFGQGTPPVFPEGDAASIPHRRPHFIRYQGLINHQFHFQIFRLIISNLLTSAQPIILLQFLGLSHKFIMILLLGGGEMPNSNYLFLVIDLLFGGFLLDFFSLSFCAALSVTESCPLKFPIQFTENFQ